MLTKPIRKTGFYLQLTTALISAFLLALTGCETQVNRPPEIEGLMAWNSSLVAGDSTMIVCDADDPDADDLEYAWDCSDGEFTGIVIEGTRYWNVGATYWTAPTTAGDYEITATVNDGSLTDEASLTLEVLPDLSQPPVPLFTVDSDTGDLMTRFEFDASASHDDETPVDQLEFRWDWQNNNSFDTEWSRSSTTGYQYPSAGTYFVSLEVRDADSLTAEHVHQLHVEDWGDPGWLVLAPADTFIMGNNDGAEEEGPQHWVILTNNFWIGHFEITNEQYRGAVQWAYDNGYVTADADEVRAYGQLLLDLDDEDCQLEFIDGEFFLKPVLHGDFEGEPCDDHPVVEVSWYGSACFCDWLSMMDGFTPFYQGNWSTSSEHNPYEAEGYTLPTEAEWEHAASYLDDRIYPWGDEAPDCDYANFYNNAFCVGFTAPVGWHYFGDSELGLQDVAGNVWERVSDFFYAYPGYSQTDPLGPDTTTYRVIRGGSFNSYDDYLTCTYRLLFHPENTDGDVGFRIVWRMDWWSDRRKPR